jgi:hypothetical protein
MADWSNLGRWEWAIGEVIILPLLFFELYRVRRSQRLDRERERRSAGADRPGHAEGQHRLDPGSADPLE